MRFSLYKSNPIAVMEKAHSLFFYIMLYNKKTNVIYSDVSPGNKLYKPIKKFTKTSWKPSPSNWLKWNTNASRFMDTHLTTIGLVCRDDNGCIIYSMGKKLSDVSVIAAEAIIIREAFRVEGN